MVKWFPLAEWWYNTSFHTAAKMTPFMALYGYHPPSITSYLRENYKVNVMKPAQEKIEKIDQRLRIQPLRGGNLVYIT